jgi:hypothetical protein
MKQNGTELGDFDIPAYQKAIEKRLMLKSVECMSVLTE